uniref:Transmembrane protein n=1 Tax=viral metagenome TaxID=1070528 RepID=A0A6C0EFM4_9ZZZZ
MDFSTNYIIMDEIDYKKELIEKYKKYKSQFLFYADVTKLILAGVELGFAITYKNDIDCSSNVISLYHWLVVTSVVNILIVVIPFIIFLMNYYIFPKYVNVVKATYILQMIYRVFVIIWIMIGLFVMARDCDDLTQLQIKAIMFASMILRGVLCVFEFKAGVITDFDEYY